MWDFVSFLDCFAKAPLHRKIFSCRISADFNHCANRAQLVFTVCLQEKRCRGEVFMCYRTGRTLRVEQFRKLRKCFTLTLSSNLGISSEMRCLAGFKSDLEFYMPSDCRGRRPRRPEELQFSKLQKCFTLTLVPKGSRHPFGIGRQGGGELANASRRLAAHPPPLETSPCAFM